MCNPVDQSTTCWWSVKMTDVAGKIRAEWNSDANFEPDWAHLHVYQQGQSDPIATHKTGKRSGTYTFSDTDYGNGLRVALVANSFESKTVEIVTTAPVNGPEPPPEVKKNYDFGVSLTMTSQQMAEVKWQSDAPFRPRQSQWLVTMPGNAEQSKWLEKPTSSIATDLRWGVGMSIGYTAEDFGGKRSDVVRTPATAL